jgi:hypothetical protein
MNEPEPTFGQYCARVIYRAKQQAQLEQRPMMVSDVARIIDRLLQERLAQAAPTSSKQAKVDAAAFGDRKKIPPTPDQVTAYSAAIGYPLNGQAWCDSYQTKGWMVGRTRMKDWQSAVRNWKTNGWGQNGIALAPRHKTQDPNYSKF